MLLLISFLLYKYKTEQIDYISINSEFEICYTYNLL